MWKSIIPLLFSLLLVSTSSGCKSPICRVGPNNGTKDMMKWMNVGEQNPGWFKTWQHMEDFRYKNIYINESDVSLLCESGCDQARNEIKRALDLYLFKALRTNIQYKIVDHKSDADFEISIKIAQVKELHYIEYINFLGSRNHYTYWFKISNIKTSNTAFWAYGIAYFNENDQQHTYYRLMTRLNDFNKDHQ